MRSRWAYEDVSYSISRQRKPPVAREILFLTNIQGASYRIIPAAGILLSPWLAPRPGLEHPRLCAENIDQIANDIAVLGTPLPMQGRLYMVAPLKGHEGTPPLTRRKGVTLLGGVLVVGLLPLMRERLGNRFSCFRIHRNTPAYAGKIHSVTLSH